MRKILGVLIIIAGIAASVYLGVWVMLVGGIIDIINQIKAPSVDAGTVAWAIVKILFCELAAIIAYVGFIVGGILFGSTKKNKKLKVGK